MAEAKIVAWGGEHYTPNAGDRAPRGNHGPAARRLPTAVRRCAHLRDRRPDARRPEHGLRGPAGHGASAGPTRRRGAATSRCGTSRSTTPLIRKRLQLSLVSLYMLNMPGLVSLDYGGELGDGQFRVFATEETRLLKSTLPVLRPE